MYEAIDAHLIGPFNHKEGERWGWEGGRETLLMSQVVAQTCTGGNFEILQACSRASRTCHDEG